MFPFGVIGSVEQFLGEFTARLTKIILIEFLDVWVEVRTAERLVLIFFIEDRGTFGTIGIPDVGVFVWKHGWEDVWLSTAIDAAAWAAHDLDEVILGGAILYLLKELSSIDHARGDGDADLGALDIKGRFPNGLESTDWEEVDWFHLFAGKHVVGGADRGFHDATGDAEDDGRAGVVTDDIVVEFLFGEAVPDDTGTSDEIAKLTGGEGQIDVADTVFANELFALDFIFLRGARNEGNDIDVLLVPAHLFGIVAL